MENKERKIENEFQVSGLGELMNTGAFVKNKKWKRVVQFGRKGKKFSLDTEFEVIMGRPTEVCGRQLKIGLESMEGEIARRTAKCIH